MAILKMTVILDFQVDDNFLLNYSLSEISVLNLVLVSPFEWFW